MRYLRPHWQTAAATALLIIGTLVGTVIADAAYLNIEKKHGVKRMHILKGAEATHKIDQLMALHPIMKQRHETFAAEMRKQGYTPIVGHDVVIETRHEYPASPKIVSLLLPALAAQDFSDGDGELSSSPWDTGDSGQFASEVMTWDYTTACTSQDNVVLDISTGQVYVISASGVITDSDGNSFWNAFGNAMQAWASCVMSGCAGAALGCLFTGPVWAACVADACGAALAIGCVIEGVRGGAKDAGGHVRAY